MSCTTIYVQFLICYVSVISSSSSFNCFILLRVTINRRTQLQGEPAKLHTDNNSSSGSNQRPSNFDAATLPKPPLCHKFLHFLFIYLYLYLYGVHQSLSSHKRALKYKERKQDAALKVRFVIFPIFLTSHHKNSGSVLVQIHLFRRKPKCLLWAIRTAFL